MRFALCRSLLLIMIFCLLQSRSQAQQERVLSLKWITLDDSTAPFVRATLGDGKVRLFMVDTGAPSCLIDRAVAKELNLAPRTATDSSGTFEYVTPPFHLGPDVLSVASAPFDLADLSADRKAFPEVAGILGMNFLFNFTVRLDYPTHRMDLLLGSAAGTSFELKDAIRLPLTIVDQHYCVEADLDGHAASFILDTGADYLFLRSPDLVKSLKPRAILSGAHTLVATDAGLETKVVDNRLLRLHRFRLGQITWEQPVVEQTLVDSRFPSNGLGNHFLERYHVVIDFPASRLYLSPDPAYKEDPLEWVGTGLTVVRYNNKVLVNCVYAPSSAKSADIAEGDEVISCDGHLLKGMSIEEVTALMQSKRKVGATVTLEIIPISHLPTRTVKLQMKQLL